jgi:2-oxoglutarate dehydrogenase E1 component
MKAREALYGPNLGYALELYERYQSDPNSVDAPTRAFFDQISSQGDGWHALATLARPSTSSTVSREVNGAKPILGEEPPPVSGNGATGQPTPVLTRPEAGLDTNALNRIVRAARLARGIREYGHLAAQIDPLGAPGPGDPMLEPATHDISDQDLAALPAGIVWPSAGPEAGTCLDAIRRLREIYCGSIGYEFDHVQDFEERAWLHESVEGGTFRIPLPPEKRRALLNRLTDVEAFERFLHRVFVGQKRFSIEGNDTLVPMLDELILRAAQSGTGEVLIGMAHRGRLNVLAHILGKPYAAIFSEFHAPTGEGVAPPASAATASRGWTGDVKYHLGAQRTVCEEDTFEIKITMADNPSHLEFVNPVVEGFARAAQDSRRQPGAPVQDPSAALPVTIHGDAAFPGEGVVAETLNFSRLPGYQTGGTVHIIVNNQIGFTTGAGAGRSTLYASDLAKGFEIPIVHVNADDPEACLAAINFAHAYRERFHRDFLVDLVGYRRWGHNEGDEPSFTQPQLYAKVSSHPTARARYAQQLEAEGIVSKQDAEAMLRAAEERLRQAREEAYDQGRDEIQSDETDDQPVEAKTAVPPDNLRDMNEALLARPDGFAPHSRLERLLARRREALDKPGGIDWALAETLAFASVLADGTPIRITGQDTERGTFSQRHLVLHDAESGREYVPLQALPQARASFAVYNSPLSEAAAVGFEYGYSVHAPEALVLWEAQFGDFVNAAQVLIDQFLVAARAKWRQRPTLVLLLPHGYEGQGPEHSSGRVERFLQLAAEDNLRLVNCTTAAQYFHVLRLQAASLRTSRRPLVIMTPKSLLRHPLAASSLQDLSDGAFRPVLDDANAGSRRNAVVRLILCSGKVAVDLSTTARTRPEPVDWVAVARVEQLYPFPEEELKHVIANYPNLREVLWLQEEPRNMGAWSYMAPRLRDLLPSGLSLTYLGRPERASPAEGSPEAHAAEQHRIIEEAFGGERQVKIDTQGVHDVS